MKYLALLVFSAFLSAAYASTKAVTDKGDVVILHDDGTWSLEDQKNVEKKEISTNKKKFKKDGDATFKVKSSKNNSEFWINPKKWAFKKGADGEPSEYTFQLIGEDLYAMAINEQIQMDVENLANGALQNARAVAPDTKIIMQEYRDVNGKKVLHMQMEGTVQSIKFIYFGYYASDEKGSTQYLAYTAKNLASKYESEIYTFLNGFSL
jgi:hypothetical protein